MNGNSDWFEQTWRYRDDVVYPDQIGGRSDGSVITIPYVAFAQMGIEQIDPRWLHCGVLIFPPADQRTAFTFVTTGLSNAWSDERPDRENLSGLGIELRLDNRSNAHWVVDVMLRLSAAQLLIGVGRITGAHLIRHGDRVTVGAETFGPGSSMTTLLATRIADIQLPSGTCQMIQLFAITDAEREYSAAHGIDSLVPILREHTTYPVNDISRRSVV